MLHEKIGVKCTIVFSDLVVTAKNKTSVCRAINTAFNFLIMPLTDYVHVFTGTGRNDTVYIKIIRPNRRN